MCSGIHIMARSVHNLRAFWFPNDNVHSQFITTTSHRFTIGHGEDHPDLSPFIGSACVQRRHFKVNDTTYTMFRTVEPVTAPANLSLQRLDDPVTLPGTVIIFRRGRSPGRLVNMRREDKAGAERLMQW